ncbi:ANR family transcriptional regulator [Serratia symbiotica]|uniref:ANR family transcriptional regulator n=1 Tax=Serratia symbiotica TaxID=138074 RepID=UPI003463DC84
MNMIAENSARNHYGLYAVGAGRAEREQNWNKAAELWRKALASARSRRCRHWAEVRMAFCVNAAAHRWGKA